MPKSTRAQTACSREEPQPTNYLETIRMLVAAGLGWSVLPLSMLQGELAYVDTPEIPLHRELRIVTRETSTLSRAAQAFAEMLVVAS